MICSSRGDEAQISSLKCHAVVNNEPSHIGSCDFFKKCCPVSAKTGIYR
jgi:hypothetical protein